MSSSTRRPRLHLGLAVSLLVLLPGVVRAQSALPLGSTVAASVPADAPASFVVELSGPGFLSVVARSLDEVDITLDVTDSDGQVVPEGSADIDFAGRVGDERVVVDVPRAGRYGVVVSSYGYEPSRVEVGASFIASELAQAAADPDGGPGGAIALAVGEDHDDDVGGGDVRDWYRVVPETDGILTVLTRADAGDLVLEVFAEGAYTEPTDRSDQDQGGVPGNEAVTIDVTAGEPLFVRVSPLFAGGDRVRYRIATGLVGG